MHALRIHLPSTRHLAYILGIVAVVAVVLAIALGAELATIGAVIFCGGMAIAMTWMMVAMAVKHLR